MYKLIYTFIIFIWILYDSIKQYQWKEFIPSDENESGNEGGVAE